MSPSPYRTSPYRDSSWSDDNYDDDEPDRAESWLAFSFLIGMSVTVLICFLCPGECLLVMGFLNGIFGLLQCVRVSHLGAGPVVVALVVHAIYATLWIAVGLYKIKIREEKRQELERSCTDPTRKAEYYLIRFGKKKTASKASHEKAEDYELVSNKEGGIEEHTDETHEGSENDDLL